MQIFIAETLEAKTLALPCPKSGCDYAADFINGRDIVVVQDADGNDMQAMSAEAFAWWENVVTLQAALDDRIESLSIDFDRDDVMSIVNQYAGQYDLADQYAYINQALDYAFNYIPNDSDYTITQAVLDTADQDGFCWIDQKSGIGLITADHAQKRGFDCANWSCCKHWVVGFILGSATPECAAPVNFLPLDAETLNIFKSKALSQLACVEQSVILCIHRGTLSLNIDDIKEFIESDFLSTNDLVDQYGNAIAHIRGDACNDLVEAFRSMIESPLEHSTLIDNAFTLDQVVEIINGDVSVLSADQLAGYYAFEAAVENAHINSDTVEFKGTIDELEPHLDVIRDAGAKFDWAKAVQVGLQYGKEHLLNLGDSL